MNKAIDFLKQYAKGKPIEMMISDGGGELPNNTDHIAEAMEAYKEHCNKSQKSAIPIVRLSLPDAKKLAEIIKWYRMQIENHGLPDRRVFREFCEKKEIELLGNEA